MHVTREEISKAKEMDLLTYLVNYEPDNLIKESNNSYCTRNHDSLKISNGLWYWFSQGFGGKTALDYLIKVEGYTFPEAVAKINGHSIDKPPVTYTKIKETPFTLPRLSGRTNRVFYYLKSRGIDPSLIQWCIDKKLIFESATYSNAVFAGYDEYGRIRYANLRGTKGNYKGEVPGSNKKYSFRITENQHADRLHVFESAIDLLSFISIQMMKKQSWQQDAYLSLGGISRQNKTLPAPLKYYLDTHMSVRNISLHLDNDMPGLQAMESLKARLQDRYHVDISPPSYGKDVNDQLLFLRNRSKTKENNER